MCQQISETDITYHNCLLVGNNHPQYIPLSPQNPPPPDLGMCICLPFFAVEMFITYCTLILDTVPTLIVFCN